MSQKDSEELLLICDLNVFVLAYLFNSKIMLSDSPYSFGKILIHEIVLEELDIWLSSKAKVKKFTEGVIVSMIEKCSELVVSEPKLSEAEKNKYFRRIANVEKKLGHDLKSSDTSDPDKTYLSIAVKSNANLATQEKTLRNVGKRIIGENRMFTFADMIIDRCKEKEVSKKEVEEGLVNLEYFDENFIRGNKKKVLDEISKV